jgi:hypothetical protein
MINKLCSSCMNTCKQERTAKVVHCPKFSKKLTENEFQNLIGEIDSMEKKTTELGRRVKNLIEKAIAGESKTKKSATEKTKSDCN